MGRGSVMCVEPSKKMPSALRGEAESASAVARVLGRKLQTTRNVPCLGIFRMYSCPVLLLTVIANCL